MTNKASSAPTLAEIRAAANRLAPYVIRSPLLQLQHNEGANNIFLKLENMQAIGAFKARPVGNVLLNADHAALKNGVYTASTGNAGLGVAWMAKKLALTATVYAPDSAPEEKLAAIARFGTAVKKLSDKEWWQVIQESHHPHDPGMYVDAVRDRLAIAGNATIGLEIVEQAPDLDTVIIPFGGGGLSCGIAAAMRALKPNVRIVVGESDAATPVTAALRAGRPVTVGTSSSFISGAGAPSVLEEMWPLVSTLVDETVVVPVAAVADAVRLLFLSQKVIAEGAGAIALAVALSAKPDWGKTVCVVSGGNIDAAVMAKILLGQDI